MRRRSQLFGPLALGLCGLGCQGLPALNLPAAIVCTRTLTAGPDTASLTATLSAARSGDCVVPAAGKYAAALTVPAGVTLAAAVGTKVELSGASAGSPAVTLGANANLSGVQVTHAPGIGISLVGGGVRLLNVTVSNAASAGVVSWCEDDCLPWPLSTLEGVELTGNSVGLLVHSAPLKMVGGHVADNHATGLAAGYGVVASHGAQLEMTDTVVENNEDLGVLVDGALGTSAVLGNVTVRKNLGRGIWAQSLGGTMQSPRLSLNSCTIDGNKLVGVGARSSSGIQIRGGRIGATVLGKGSSAMPGVLVDVGDGLGLFAATSQALVENVTLDLNQRSQILIDQGASGLTVTGGMISVQSGQFGVVVQNTSATVQAPMSTTPDAGNELPISAPTLAIPVR